MLGTDRPDVKYSECVVLTISSASIRRCVNLTSSSASIRRCLWIWRSVRRAFGGACGFDEQFGEHSEVCGFDDQFGEHLEVLVDLTISSTSIRRCVDLTISSTSIRGCVWIWRSVRQAFGGVCGLTISLASIRRYVDSTTVSASICSRSRLVISRFFLLLRNALHSRCSLILEVLSLWTADWRWIAIHVCTLQPLSFRTDQRFRKGN